MASVSFESTSVRLRLVHGTRADGAVNFIAFVGGKYTTEDPAEIEKLLALMKQEPGLVTMTSGALLCPVCNKGLATEFALKGHMRTHEKEKTDGASGEE